MKPTPILFFGDSPDLRSGLGRIGRDLASLCATLPQFRVGFLGRAGTGSRQLPFAQYNFPESAQWGEDYIEHVWRDFAGNEHGVIFTIWDPSRLTWFGNPLPAVGRDLYRFLTEGNFDRWGYFPVDALGPSGRLSTYPASAFRLYKRVLAYGCWGAEALGRTLGREVPSIPHGMNLNAYKPRDRAAARMALSIPREIGLVVGCLMNNQARKDWGLAFATVAELKKKHKDLKFWIHIDLAERKWSLPALIADYGLGQNVIVTQAGSKDDVELSYHYSACDITILPSLGEGFGFPLVESMACGVPVVHGKYGGGVELLPRDSWLVDPVAWRLEGLHNCVRPVYRPEDWAEAIERVLAEKNSCEFCRSAVDFISWKNLWPAAWQKWFLEGLTNCP